eukprot:CAMPEP_0174937618 /NCGR_PEP_ID=MMETSP1355-20121228/60993_1 /TAXON_ID=464990 /ORGANISM="Hemiselmis tepida, Strain CCMP443" /LENGTH=103 /DNA_ID=CAMNT_0016184475 /DNA_START=29 /DNA_END=336 /DNA_ORIENTATION=+
MSLTLLKHLFTLSCWFWPSIVTGEPSGSDTLTLGPLLQALKHSVLPMATFPLNRLSTSAVRISVKSPLQLGPWHTSRSSIGSISSVIRTSDSAPRSGFPRTCA